MKRWDTILELKENHHVIGLKGMYFFIVDFVRDLKTPDLKYVISTPTFSGMGVGPGIASFVLDKEELECFFVPIEKTFDEYQRELKEAYLKESSNE